MDAPVHVYVRVHAYYFPTHKGQLMLLSSALKFFKTQIVFQDFVQLNSSNALCFLQHGSAKAIFRMTLEGLFL